MHPNFLHYNGYPASICVSVNDEVVLIGDEFWDLVGGPGAYQSFIDEINKLGISYKERIYREFLGIEPPMGFENNTLR